MYWKQLAAPFSQSHCLAKTKFLHRDNPGDTHQPLSRVLHLRFLLGHVIAWVSDMHRLEMCVSGWVGKLYFRKA